KTDQPVEDADLKSDSLLGRIFHESVGVCGGGGAVVFVGSFGAGGLSGARRAPYPHRRTAGFWMGLRRDEMFDHAGEEVVVGIGAG
ncbi:MAG: hypothetical protein AABZ47_11470, partial [Planctomycetota bacterium]